MKQYKVLLALPHVMPLLIAAFPGRIGYSMVGLGIFFKTQQTTGSVATAGITVGLYSLSGSVSTGLRALLIERWGQTWPLMILVPSYTLMIIAFNTMQTKESLLITAFILGISAPPINIAVRPLWKGIVPDKLLRTAYALDTSMVSFTTIIGPIVITFLSLSSRPGLGLGVTAALMFIGGLGLASTVVSRNWIAEKKTKDQQSIWRDRAIQLLMLQGCFFGFSAGVFGIAVPAFATQEGVAQRVAWLLAAFGVANMIGGLVGGLVSKNLTPLSALLRSYVLWVIATIPIAFTYPDWTMAVVGAAGGFIHGAFVVYYFEVLEAVRPHGTQASSIGWIWSIEGTFTGAGAALGGIVSEYYSPRVALALTPIMLVLGLIVFILGKGRLKAANIVPTDE
jgi:predicted MFS family arabinose efflux permease